MDKRSGMSNRKKIVVADDEAFILSAIKDTLSDDYDVKTAVDGKSALALIKKEVVDMVILDVMMPEMDGIEVCRYMKNDKDLKSIPVIFITAKGQMPDIERGFKSGIDAYIVKPFSPGKLIEKIEELFQKVKIREKMVKAK
jgi:two-component system alkaline phosphatase synthesis response regulator PhoP